MLAIRDRHQAVIRPLRMARSHRSWRVCDGAPRVGASWPVIAAAIPGAVLAMCACGNRSAPPLPIPREAGPADAAIVVEVAASPLGAPDLAAFGWRKREGQPAFRVARGAEARGDWAAVVTSCRQALAVDPGHLEAAWLLAVGLAKLGKLDEVLVPLARAAAGDFAKWGQASLELPGLQGFLATPAGEAWRRRVELDRARYVAAIARSVIVTGDGELHAVVLPATTARVPDEPVPPGAAGPADADADAGRWLRLTRTPGTVVGALAIPSAQKIAYVARERRKGKREVGVGVIDVRRGASSGVVRLGAPGPLAVAYSARAPAGFWVGSGKLRQLAWRRLDDEYQLHALPPRTPRPPGPWLEVGAKASIRLHALPSNVTADWDDQSLASAIRIGTSHRVVSVPSPGLIDGNTAAWSPDRAHLAFVAQLDDHCAPGAVNTAAFVADGATGATRELERAAGGIALQWLAERKLAVAGDRGVTVYSLDGAAPIAIEGATGLMIPRERPRCAPVEKEDEAPDALDAPDAPDDSDAAAGDEPVLDVNPSR
jgi:hypothetical protein